MGKNEFRYREIYSLAAEVSACILDMDGGRFLLAVMVELMQDFLDSGDIFAAEVVAAELCSISETLYESATDLNEEEKSAWLIQFSEMLSAFAADDE